MVNIKESNIELGWFMGGIVSLNKKIAMVLHDDSNYILFDTEEGCYIYSKELELLYKVTADLYFRLLLKIEMITGALWQKK